MADLLLPPPSPPPCSAAVQGLAGRRGDPQEGYLLHGVQHLHLLPGADKRCTSAVWAADACVSVAMLLTVSWPALPGCRCAPPCAPPHVARPMCPTSRAAVQHGQRAQGAERAERVPGPLRLPRLLGGVGHHRGLPGGQGRGLCVLHDCRYTAVCACRAVRQAPAILKHSRPPARLPAAPRCRRSSSCSCWAASSRWST